MITEIYKFWVFWSKNGRFVTHNCFSKKKGPETPIFIVFFGCAFSGPRCQKGKFCKATQKKGKLWLITEKLFFGVFAVFFGGLLFFSFFLVCFFLFVSFFFVFLCFLLEGLRVRWGGKGPPHLALNPPYFFFCFCFLFFVLFFWEGLRVRWGGPKGHLTWP